jgi:hypothetical protein
VAGVGRERFAEYYSEFPGLDVPYIHYSQFSTDPNVTSYGCLINQHSFNTYGVGPGRPEAGGRPRICLTCNQMAA